MAIQVNDSDGSASEATCSSCWCFETDSAQNRIQAQSFSPTTAGDPTETTMGSALHPTSRENQPRPIIGYDNPSGKCNVYQGTLEKKSRWTRSWDKRMFTLQDTKLLYSKEEPQPGRKWKPHMLSSVEKVPAAPPSHR